LCSAGAAEAFGTTLKNHALTIEPLNFDEPINLLSNNAKSTFLGAIKDSAYEALRGLANMLELQKEAKKAHQKHRISSSLSLIMSSKELLIKGCLDVAKSGGLSGVLWISTLPNTPSSLSESTMMSFDRMDLLEESCRLLANISPLLLSDTAASDGVTKWASDIFEALDRLLHRINENDDGNLADESIELIIDPFTKKKKIPRCL
jgi:hypothetical protein